MTYDGEGRRTKVATTPANGATTTREFRYQGDAIVEEKVGGTVARQYLVDESGSVVEMVVPAGANAGTYVVTWNGHGDALALWRITPDGSLELANSFSYSTWGKPTISGSHPNSANGNAAYGDLGFRFLYVGEFDVQWDDAFGLDLAYMHARHYSPSLGRFLQPDPDRTEANPYAYAANNPVTEIDPDGTCFIVCQIVVGAVIDAVVYVATTDNANLAGLASAVAGGAVESAINPLSKFTKVAKLAKAGAKILSKVPKAARRTINHFGRTAQLSRWTRSTSRGVDRAIARGDQAALRRMGAYAGDARVATSRSRAAALARGNVIDHIVKNKARGSRYFRDATITRRGQRGVDFHAPGVFRGRRTYDVTTRGMAGHHRTKWPGVRLFFTR